MEEKKDKKVKKKIKIKFIPIFIFMFFITTCYFIFVFVSELPIKNIYIKGNYILKDQEIIDIAKLSNYPSFLKTSSKDMKKKLSNNPYISKVNIDKKIYNTVIIDIEEAIPLFINTDNMLVLSNKKEVSNDYNISVPTLINYVPDTKYIDLINKIKKINKDIWGLVSEIKYASTEQDKDRFGLYMNDGNLVYLTLTKFDKLNYYKDIINEFDCQKGILNLDSGNHFEIKETYCTKENQ